MLIFRFKRNKLSICKKNLVELSQMCGECEAQAQRVNTSYYLLQLALGNSHVTRVTLIVCYTRLDHVAHQSKVSHLGHSYLK